jgi:threonine/homoserine/homoserine lactone efflux protein
MDLLEIASFALVAFLLVMTPGPNGVLIAKTVPTSGRAAGFWNVGGFVTAFYLHGTLSIFGISIILVHSAEAFFVLKMAGAAYLCWIGLKSLWAAWKGAATVQAVKPARRVRTHLSAYVEGFLTNALNPKVSIFYLAAFPQFIPAGDWAVAEAYLLVTVHAVLNGLWFTAMIILFARLTVAARRGSFQRWLKGVTGAVFIGFGVKLASFRPS